MPTRSSPKNATTKVARVKTIKREELKCRRRPLCHFFQPANETTRSFGCQSAAPIAEASVADSGHLERSRFYSQGGREDGRTNRGENLGLALPPASRHLL